MSEAAHDGGQGTVTKPSVPVTVVVTVYEVEVPWAMAPENRAAAAAASAKVRILQMSNRIAALSCAASRGMLYEAGESGLAPAFYF